ncbi:hypothetical protein DXG01_007070 [Tephrocybe rancida]|nr:hypothetical protein DXG01_007070 [Tephrocybe rancida]
MSSASSSSLKQVSELFEACIAQVRSKPAENFEAEAAKWIKSARVNVMKRIEQNFSYLSKNADDPMLVPSWATNPSIPLTISGGSFNHHSRLDAYIPSFVAKLQGLMEECGFQATVSSTSLGDETMYFIRIKFPSSLPAKKSTSQVAKCFDTLPKFSAAVLRITEGVEEPILLEGPVKRVTRGAATRKVEKRKAKSAVKTTGASKQGRGTKRTREFESEEEHSNRRVSKRLRQGSPSALDNPEESPTKTTKSRRSGRLEGR